MRIVAETYFLMVDQMASISPDISTTVVIMTCFAGRRNVIPILFRYAVDLLKRNLVQKFHVWNYAQDPEDEEWLKQSISTHRQPSAVLQMNTKNYEYQKVTLTLRTGDTIHFRVKARTNAQLLLHNRIDHKIYEITVGGFENTKSTICYGIQGILKTELKGSVLNAQEYVDVVLSVDKAKQELVVLMTGDKCMRYRLPSQLSLFEIYLSSWDSEEADWEYYDPFEFEVTGYQHEDKIALMNVSNKKVWQEYYKHYNSARYPNHIIIKCDDDVVFIDNDMFKSFIEARLKDNNHVLMFPSIINNEICSFIQAAHDLIPPYVLSPVVYTPNGTGVLWGSGKKAQRLHEYFLENHLDFIEKSKKIEPQIQDINFADRISINFFAIKSNDLYVFQIIGNEDESELTQCLPSIIGRGHCLYMGFLVSHLAFANQRKTGLDEYKIVNEYYQLSDQIM